MDDASSLPDPDLFDYKAKLEVIPESPGVYLMIAKNDKIVYIGKSINLKSRVRSYFTGGDPRPFVKRLPKILKEIEFIVAPSERDALVLLPASASLSSRNSAYTARSSWSSRTHPPTSGR